MHADPHEHLPLHRIRQNAHLLPVDSTELAPPSNLDGPVDAEKLVVVIDDSPSSSSIEITTDEAPEEPSQPVPIGIPRLDFGMITVQVNSPPY